MVYGGYLMLFLARISVICHKLRNSVGWERESNVLSAEIYGGIYADDISERVYKWSAAVSGTDGCTGLYGSGKHFLSSAILSSCGNDPIQSTDNPLRNRVLVFSKGVSDSIYSLSDHKMVGIVQFQKGEIIPRYFQQGYVVVGGPR